MKLAIKLDFHSVINFRTIAIIYCFSEGKLLPSIIFQKKEEATLGN